MKFNKIFTVSVCTIILTASLSFLAPAQDGQGAYNGGVILPEKTAPRGMLELQTNGAGRILTSRMSGTASARKMLAALRIGVAEYFDSGITLTAAFADEDDQNLQAAFIAKIDGISLHGVIAIEMQGDSGQATMLFDRAARFATTFSRMSQVVNDVPTRERVGPPAPVRLTVTPLLDGSGQIGLPPGWRVTGSYKGTVDAVGPNGEMLMLGGYAIVTTKQASWMFPGIPPVNFTDPVRAAIDFADYQAGQARKNGQPASVVTKIWDTRPLTLANHPAAFIRFSANIAGRPYEGLGLYSIMPTDQAQAVFYYSVALAPESVFRGALPGMWAAWQSWGIKDEVFRERLTSTLRSMRETGDILTGSDQNRRETYARVNKAWDQYIRGESTMFDPDTGKRYTFQGGAAPANLPPDVRLGNLQPVPLKDL